MKRAERKKRSFKRGGIAVIGEGPTEQYYLLSVQGLMAANVYPTKSGFCFTFDDIL